MQKITIKDENFPELLKKIPNPPQQLYFEGTLNKTEKYPLAVVGTRKVSSYGKQVTEYFIKTLAQSGLTIISGLALGIDGLAHQTTLDVGGRTIAVLGSGFNNIFPTVHKKLFQKIIESGGAVISEYPPETPAYKGNFPARNRIISGLSIGVLVIEAPKKSGALITAEQAIKQKRKVFVVPGRIYDRNSAGTNQLIKQGVQAVTNPQDILKSLKIKSSFAKKQRINNLSEQEKLLLKFLSENPIHIDELTKKTKMKTNEIISCLTIMEINGVIKDMGGGKYVKLT
ncbi:DNA-processing protein DprA [Patescibacteria group bacterium]|nr:DNA-processing protein DprA [Patescibacteria group bacterium]